jgi:ABC-2 type transport system ATP-binding protein
MVAGSVILVRALDPGLLATALERAELTAARHADGSFVVDAEAVAVGRAAAAAGVVLIELRRADGSGLEELFLSLTRETPAGANAGAVPSRPTHDAPAEVAR